MPTCTLFVSLFWFSRVFVSSSVFSKCCWQLFKPPIKCLLSFANLKSYIFTASAVSTNVGFQDNATVVHIFTRTHVNSIVCLAAVWDSPNLMKCLQFLFSSWTKRRARPFTPSTCEIFSELNAEQSERNRRTSHLSLLPWLMGKSFI
jgi:hypothetical protein